MKLLVLGGTKNLGRHVIEAASAAGHDVTMFNRGLTNPSLFPPVPAHPLVGDRADPAALAAGEWDGVIDMSGFLVRDVRLSAAVLRERCDHYTYMSSIAVYADKATAGQTEAGPLVDWPAGAPEDRFTMDLYGPSKVRNEALLATTYGPRTSAIRSGFVVGPYNPDFGNWGQALADNRPLECAARPAHPVQYVDARDLAAFLLHVTVDRIPGPFNVVGPTRPIADVAERWRSVVPNPPPVDWSPDTDLFHLHDEGLFQLDNSRALAAGLQLRPDADSARDYVAWIRAGNTPPPPPH